MAVVKRRVPRLYLKRELTGDKLTLDEREAHYLGRVLRLQRGDALVTFNGRGTERHASVASLQRRGAELSLGAMRAIVPESRLELTLLQALPKADAMDFVVQKATELGALAIVPVYTEFSVVKLDEERAQRRVEHWRRIAESACEQCGRHAPPRIEIPDGLAAGLARLAPDGLRIAFDTAAEQPWEQSTTPRALVAAVGPEGGLGTDDWRLLDGAGFVRAGLGPRVLRAETAALTICAIAQARWGDLCGGPI
jgi:16S rRNA (uracil1498-N3)-methyltransferase